MVTNPFNSERLFHPSLLCDVVGTLGQKTEFRCPEEFGYYPHPTDCSLYYVCVFGGPLLESCTGGLVYSQDLQTCDWPRNVACTRQDNAISDTTDTFTNTHIDFKKVSRTIITEDQELQVNLPPPF